MSLSPGNTMAQIMETYEEPEEPDPEFMDKLAAFHEQRGSVFL